MLILSGHLEPTVLCHRHFSYGLFAPAQSHRRQTAIGRMPSANRFCFTINNYTDNDIELVCDLDSTYLVFGKEIAPSTGTPHIQGYVVFDPRSPPGLRSLRVLVPRAVWIIARGTSSENRRYCLKIDKHTGVQHNQDFIENGECPLEPRSAENGRRGGAAERSRWTIAREAAIEGRFEDVPDEIYIRNYSSIVAIARAHQRAPPSRDTLACHWYWGESGSGKSSTARFRFPVYYTKDLTKWWDGYQEEETVIVDDMDPFHKSMGQLFKLWGDHYAFRAESKGSSRLIRPKRIVVTSQYSINQIWDDDNTRQAMHRRFKEEEFKRSD